MGLWYGVMWRIVGEMGSSVVLWYFCLRHLLKVNQERILTNSAYVKNSRVDFVYVVYIGCSVFYCILYLPWYKYGKVLLCRLHGIPW